MRDAFGNATPVVAELELNLSSDSPTTQFFDPADSTCQSPLVPARLSVPAGENTGFFRFRDPTPGEPKIAVHGKDAGVEGPNVPPAHQDQTVL